MRESTKRHPPAATHPWNRKASGPAATAHCPGCGIVVAYRPTDHGTETRIHRAEEAATDKTHHDPNACTRARAAREESAYLLEYAAGTFWRRMRPK